MLTLCAQLPLTHHSWKQREYEAYFQFARSSRAALLPHSPVVIKAPQSPTQVDINSPWLDDGPGKDQANAARAAALAAALADLDCPNGVARGAVLSGDPQGEGSKMLGNASRSSSSVITSKQLDVSRERARRMRPLPIMPAIGETVAFNHHNRALVGVVTKSRAPHCQIEYIAANEGGKRERRSKVWIEARQLRRTGQKSRTTEKEPSTSNCWFDGGSICTRRIQTPISPVALAGASLSQEVPPKMNLDVPFPSRWQYRRLGQHLYMRPTGDCPWVSATVGGDGRPVAMAGASIGTTGRVTPQGISPAGRPTALPGGLGPKYRPSTR